MSLNRTKKNKSGGRRQKVSQAYYVYCIGEYNALAPLFGKDALPVPIESEAGLELVVSNELAAVMSTVPLTDYSDEALPSRLADATWLAVRAIRHKTVVEYFAARASVVPLRFGTIYLQRASVEQMLSERNTELRAIIERLCGQEEWGINVLCDRAKLIESITSLRPRLRELTEQAASASPGQSYLMRKKIDAMRDDETRAEIKHVIANIEQTLTFVSNGVARLRVLETEATEHGELVAKLAFLVARGNFSEFRAAAERLAQEHGASGVQLELTGPWPAYNFTVKA